MKEPKPEDFGLTEKDVSKYKKHEEKFLIWSVITSMIILGLGSGIYEALTIAETSLQGRLVAGFLVGFLGVGGGFFVGMFIVLTFDFALPFFSKKIKSFRKFQKAKKKFEAWFVRTQTLFWQSLSGRRFEHEFAFLLSKNGYKIKN
ncbi:MAG: hypothetical protein ACE5IC_06660 [Candidatus Brocadiales bacterium]